MKKILPIIIVLIAVLFFTFIAIKPLFEKTTISDTDRTVTQNAEFVDVACEKNKEDIKPKGPRLSSNLPCVGETAFSCDLEESCDWINYDLLLPSGSDWTPPSQGDGLCHKLCNNNNPCADGEECRQVPYYISDTPTQFHSLCFCLDKSKCKTFGPGYTKREPEGGLNTWRKEKSMPIDLYYHSSAAGEEFLFVSGGLSVKELQHGGASATLEVNEKVFAAPISSDGSLGEWQETLILPEKLLHHAMAISNGRLYVSGGEIILNESPFKMASPSVYSTEITKNGLGEWRKERNLPAGRQQHIMAIYENLIIIAGGTEDARYFTDGTLKVYIGIVDDNGGISNWNTLNAPITPTAFTGGAGVVKDRLYVLNENKMFSGKINQDGTISEWRDETYPNFATTPHPYPQQTVEPFNFLMESCVRVVAMGENGHTSTAVIGNNNSLVAWRLASRIYGANSGYAVALNQKSGYIYVSGGSSGRTPIQKISDVWSSKSY